jgi:predicted nucleic acid-binding protein
VRFITGDHPEQSASARALIEAEDVYVATTVLLEAEWVLRRVYGLAARSIAKALRQFGGLPHVTFENPASVAQALDWVDGGLDFADALHLAHARGCDGFVSFDRNFARAANKLSTIKMRLP